MTVDVMLQNNKEVGGFQFTISGADIVKSYGGVAGGLNYNLYNSADTVIGFAIPIVPIPVSLLGQPLVTLDLDKVVGPICFTETVSSDVLGIEIPSTWGPCIIPSIDTGGLAIETGGSGLMVWDTASGTGLTESGVSWDTDTGITSTESGINWDTDTGVSSESGVSWDTGGDGMDTWDTGLGGDTWTNNSDSFVNGDTSSMPGMDTGASLFDSGATLGDSSLLLGDTADTSTTLSTKFREPINPSQASSPARLYPVEAATLQASPISPSN